MLRVMTANLFNGAGSPAALKGLLDRYRPDVMSAQELSPNQAVVMERHFAHGVVKPQDNTEGAGLMARHEMYVDVLPLAFRDALVGAINFGGERVEIIGIHLANPIDGPTGRLAERRRQLAVITPRITLPGRRILLGDLNSTPAWPAYRRLTAHMSDSVSDWASRNGVAAQRTWAYRPRWRAMLRIDHVFATGLYATHVRVRKIDGSDHRALIVDLELS